MIVTLTLNPALDKSTDVSQLVPEKKMRCSDVLIEAGGGGINVSKAVKELGGESLAVFFAGGLNGEAVTRLLKEKDIAVKAVPIKGDTRENFVVNETATARQYRFVMPGPSICKDELKTIGKTILGLPQISFLVCSGSLPPGVDASFLGQLALTAKKKGIKFIADTSGVALKKAMENGAYLIKPSLTELCSLAGKEYLEPSEIATSAKAVFRQSNCEAIIISMGPSGAMLVTKDGAKEFNAPTVKRQTTVGAGDSMVAGIVWMLKKGESLENAVQFGIACGTAATINKGTQLFKKADALKFYEWIKQNSAAIHECDKAL